MWIVKYSNYCECLALTENHRESLMSSSIFIQCLCMCDISGLEQLLWQKLCLSICLSVYLSGWLGACEALLIFHAHQGAGYFLNGIFMTLPPIIIRRLFFSLVQFGRRREKKSSSQNSWILRRTGNLFIPTSMCVSFLSFSSFLLSMCSHTIAVYPTAPN